MNRYKNAVNPARECRSVFARGSQQVTDSGWATGTEILPGSKADVITSQRIITEIFGWSGAMMNRIEGKEENNPSTEPDESGWQNNEDPEAAETANEKGGTGTTHGDTTIDKDVATDERIGGNEAAGAGAAGGTGGTGTGS